VSGLGLAIELSQREGSIAVGDGRAAPAVRRFASGGARHDDPLMPAIDAAVRELGGTPRDLRLIAVSTGPGGFTGLRIAATAARMLAEALGARRVVVPSALVAAAGASAPGPWLVAAAAKRGSVWATRVAPTDAGLAIVGVPGIANAAEADLSGVRTLLADEHAPPELVERARALGLVVESHRLDAIRCLELGFARAAAGIEVDPLRLAPLYPREPEAVTLWRERHG
jgi:tRNA threonylcarbamoyl adenosine modification protein YeaZ